MRKLFVAVLVATFVPAVPALAQSNVDARVGKLESEMRAVQRKVFPGGAGAYLEPQITPSTAPAGPGPGTPASSAIDDVTQRLASLEGQMATLTGQIEQNQYRLRTLEEQFAAYRKATDARFTAAPVAAAPDDDPAPVAAAPTRPTRPAAGGSDATRAARATALQRPATADAAEDSYLYGYRLWEAKLYPEAVAQLKTTVAEYPKHRRASYAQNLIGRSYLDDNKPSLASIAFYDNYKKMPDGERAADSLYYLATALVRLNKPADACKVYGELTEVYGEKLTTQRKSEIASGRTAAKCR